MERVRKLGENGPIVESPSDELMTPITVPVQRVTIGCLAERALFLKGEDWRSTTDRRRFLPLPSCFPLPSRELSVDLSSSYVNFY